MGLQRRTSFLQACAPATARDFHNAGVGHAARDAAVEIFGCLVDIVGGCGGIASKNDSNRYLIMIMCMINMHKLNYSRLI